MKAIKEAIQKLATMGSIPASLQSMLEPALREDEGRKLCDCDQGRLPCTCKPAEQHQGAPVAEVEIGFNRFNDTGEGLFVKWLLPDGAPPPAGTKLYTHADPAEVERLREQFKCDYQDFKRERAKWWDERDTLRAQLAEAHALLRHLYENNELSLGDDQRILSALSASAEPIVTFTGDDITEGSDLLGKGLGRIIEQQVISQMERDERSAPVNPCMSAASFVEQYSKESGLSVREFYDEQVPMPDPSSPSGWAAVSNSPISIKAHVDTRLAEPTGSRHYYCGKVKVVLGHGSYAICGQLGPGGEALQREDCAAMGRKP